MLLTRRLIGDLLSLSGRILAAQIITDAGGGGQIRE